MAKRKNSKNRNNKKAESIGERIVEELKMESSADTVDLGVVDLISPETSKADDIAEAAEEVSIPETGEVTDFTLVMDPVIPDEEEESDKTNKAESGADMISNTDENDSHDSWQNVSDFDEKLAAEYAAARAQGTSSPAAITPIIPVTGYGNSYSGKADAYENTAGTDNSAGTGKSGTHVFSKVKVTFDKPVTRKFLAAALCISLVLNGAIAAGIMALYSHGIRKDVATVKETVSELEDNYGNSDNYDNFGNGGPGMGMMPPDWNGSDNWGGSQEQQSSSGVSIGIVISDNNGVYVSQVTGSNAQKAGFQEGDKIVSFDGEDIDDSNELISEVQKHKSGDKVTVVVERSGKEVKLKTTLE